MAHETKQMTFEEFKACLFERYGEKNVILAEHGKHGWSDVTDILDKKPGGRPGPHWCDAGKREPESLSGRGQYLYGSYNFNIGLATFYNIYPECKS